MNSMHRLSIKALFVLMPLFLTLGINLTQAQTAQPNVIASTKWQINQNLCPATGRCGRMWRLSRDNSLLYLYTVGNRQLYIISQDTETPVLSYDLSSLPSFQDQYFDFMPYNDHAIIYFDEMARRLSLFDLDTGETTAFVVDGGLQSCTNDFDPPHSAFYYLPLSDSLIVCRFNLGDVDSRVISSIDLTTNQIEDIVQVDGGNRRYPPYVRVVAGHDGNIYVEPGVSELWPTLIPDYNERYSTTQFIQRWNVDMAQWETIEINSPALTSPSFIGVDAQSNMYFEEIAGSPKITKVRADVTVVAVLTESELGTHPFVIDIRPDGTLTILNRESPDGDTTGMEISNYAVDIPTSPPTATDIATSTPTSTNTAFPTLGTVIVQITVPIADGSVITTTGQTRLQATAHDTAVGTTDGSGIQQVAFEVYDPSNALISNTTDNTPSYCAFGGDAPCNAAPPNPNPLQGTYTFRARAQNMAGTWSEWVTRTFVIGTPSQYLYFPYPFLTNFHPRPN